MNVLVFVRLKSEKKLETWQFSVQIKDRSYLAYTNEDDETWYFSAELLEYRKNEFAKLKTDKGKIIIIEKIKQGDELVST